MRFFSRFWRFLTSVQVGIVLILILMLVMMYATKFEASTSTRAMKHYIYEALWFDVAVYLFVLNVLVNTWRRRPFRFRHAGFLIVHGGVLVVVLGALLTRSVGIDGSIAIPEGKTSREVLLPGNDLLIDFGESRRAHSTHFEVRPLARAPRDLYEVPDSPYWVRVDRYFPTGAVADTVIADPAAGTPAVQLMVGGAGGSPRAAWLVTGDPARAAVHDGDAAVRLVSPAEWEVLRSEWAKRDGATAEVPQDAGRLQLFWADGETEVLTVPGVPGAVLPTTHSGLAIEVVRVFRSFVITGEGPAEGSGEASNPAIQFDLRKGEGREEHLAFANFPDFRRMHPTEEERVLEHATWEPNPATLAGERAPREIALEWTAAGGLVTHTSWADPLDGAGLVVGETRTFAGGDVLLRVSETVASGRLVRTMRKVSDEIRDPVVHVTLLEAVAGEAKPAWLTRLTAGQNLVPAAVTPNEAWVFLGEGQSFPTPRGPLRVAYTQRLVTLDFEIRLDDFVEERYPGTSIPASYESHVTVGPGTASEFAARIYMNHPLKHGGYTFFQASFQRLRDSETTILSVSQDPGQLVSFAGYCILVLGLVLIFFFKPLLRRLDERTARPRSLGAQP